MKVCGLTGGVGMGKSTAADFFRQSGAAIVDTDEIARQLVRPGQPALREIRAAFGEKVIGAAGELDRAGLAQIVFADAAARRKLESILHPPIRATWLAQIETWRSEKKPLAVVIIPLLFETRAESEFAKTICVACSAAAQHERLLARGWPPEQIRLRNAAQMPVEQKIARADFVVWTDGDLDVTAAQVDRIVAKL